MNYYKILINNKIISIASEYDFRKYQKKYNLILYSNITEAEFISALDENFYYDVWFKPIQEEHPLKLLPAKIETISEENYYKLLEAFQNNKDIIDQPIEQQDVIENYYPEQTIEQETIKDLKLQEIRRACSLAIQRGFELVINSQKRIFPLEITDQLNIARLYQEAMNGETFLPYHFQDGLCELFTKSDIALLYKQMSEHINYHTIYYNALKGYVKSLPDTEISSIFYGIDIPEFYQTDALKAVM